MKEKVELVLMHLREETRAGRMVSDGYYETGQTFEVLFARGEIIVRTGGQEVVFGFGELARTAAAACGIKK